MSHERLDSRIGEIKGQVAAKLVEAEGIDQAEGAEFGEERWGDELPKGLASREGRLARMRVDWEAIEAEAKEKSAATAARKAAEHRGDESAIAEAAELAAAKATASKRAQRSFTGPDARMMKTTDRFHSAYNAQTVIDEASQMVLAAEVTNEPADVGALITMIGITEGKLDAANIDASPDLVLANAGCCSEANLTWITETESDVLVATVRIKNGERLPGPPRGRIPNDAIQCCRMTR